jgi:hypothetical protein
MRKKGPNPPTRAGAQEKGLKLARRGQKCAKIVRFRPIGHLLLFKDEKAYTIHGTTQNI